VERPPPPRLVRRALDRETADPHQLEPSVLELAHLVGCVEDPEVDAGHGLERERDGLFQ
jgi:hypothetical protein